MKKINNLLALKKFADNAAFFVMKNQQICHFCLKGDRKAQL